MLGTARRLALVVPVLLLFAAPAPADETVLFPDVSLNLRAAYYVPDEPLFRYTGWMGGGAGLVRTHDATVYFTACVETIIGTQKRPFDPDEANYHLEVGVDRPFGTDDLNPFFHHVSRHLVDRPKDATVDWNVLGLRGSRDVRKKAPFKTRLTASIGHTTRTAPILGYEWEFIGRAELGLRSFDHSELYLNSDARLVTTQASAVFNRNHFVDGAVEAGIRFAREGRALELYAAYEHRNDVFLLAPGARDRLLLGFHIGAGPSRDLWYER